MSNIGPVPRKKAEQAKNLAMQYSLQVFHQEEEDFDFRVIDQNGEPWFVLSDVAKRIGIQQPRTILQRLDEDETTSVILNVNGTRQNVTIINESGLYSAILRSEKPEAKKFKKWVTSEVLPAIRKTGSYTPKQPAFIKRFNENWNRIEPGYFSVISELAVRLMGRMEMVGHVMADSAPSGVQNRPDVSVGRLFASWLRENHPDKADQFKYYSHKTDEWEGDARQYPMSILPLYIEFVDTVWIPERSEQYFNTRDPAALPYLPKLLPPTMAAE